MAMCATQSYPEQVKTCPPDSDRNILDPAVSPKHVGTAYEELQFYPPGWVPWPTWAVAVGASSCDPTKWCAALNVDSLALNPVNGKTLNPTCLAKVGEEYVNFAFVTKNGKAQAPPNPVDSTLKTFTPSSKDLFMNSGDRIKATLTDTRNGLKVILHDLTTGRTGSMTASAANGFAQVKFAPKGKSCTALPYNFHPMYSTSSTKTRVTWAAGSYNVAFDTEIGHFQFCTGPVKIPATPFGLSSNGSPTTCPTGDMEGRGASASAPDADDLFCFPASEALVYKVTGCSFTNTGFDGASYQKLWPDGNTQDHPAPFQFTSARTGPNYGPTVSASRAGDRFVEAHRIHVQPGHRRGLHADPADRPETAGRVLSVLLDHQQQARLHLAVRQQHSWPDHRLRQERRIRPAARAVLHPEGWQQCELLPGFPQPNVQPVPGRVNRPAVRADYRS